MVIYTMEHYAAERKKKRLHFMKAWLDPESIMLNEISHGVKDKCRIISRLSENLIDQSNKATKYNREHWNKEQIKKNKEGRGRSTMSEEWEGSSNNMDKGHIDKANGG